MEEERSARLEWENSKLKQEEPLPGQRASAMMELDGGVSNRSSLWRHSTTQLMDDQLALVGSVNLDIRSLQLNFELTLTLFSPEACASIRRLLDGYLQDSTPLELERWKQRSRASRVLERGMFFLSPLL